MDEIYRYRQSVEVWLVHNKLVASQQAYTHAYFKETCHEVKHYYCPDCGSAWGLRIDTEAKSPRHHFYSSECNDCGGDQNMLTPWESKNLNILGSNVLAYLILTTDPEGLT